MEGTWRFSMHSRGAMKIVNITGHFKLSLHPIFIVNNTLIIYNNITNMCSSFKYQLKGKCMYIYGLAVYHTQPSTLPSNSPYLVIHLTQHPPYPAIHLTHPSILPSHPPYTIISYPDINHTLSATLTSHPPYPITHLTHPSTLLIGMQLTQSSIQLKVTRLDRVK